MKTQAKVEFLNKGDINVIIKVNQGKSYTYPYNDYHSYLEVSTNFDKTTFKPEMRGENVKFSYRLLRYENDSLANWQSRLSACTYFLEENVAKAEKLVLKNLRALHKLIKTGSKNPVYLLMKPIADSIIKHYMEDFTYHDNKTLQTYQPDKFIWLVRESGTWLLISDTKESRNILDHALKGCEYKIYLYGTKQALLTVENDQNFVKEFLYTLPKPD